MNKLLPLLFFIITSVLPINIASCSCPESPSPCFAYSSCSAAFIGTVTSTAPNWLHWFGHAASVRVDRVFKGKIGTTIKVDDLGGSCALHLTVGEQYLFYARYDPDANKWLAMPCGFTMLVSHAREHLLFLDSLPYSLTEARVSGVVMSSASDHNDSQLSEPPPIEGIKIVLTRAGQPTTAISGLGGVFQFVGLLPGKYSIAIQVPDGMMLENYWGSPYKYDPLSVELNTADCYSVTFILRKRRQ